METRRKQSPEQIAYLAGVIDSDGYIGILKSKPYAGNTKNPAYGLTVNVTNTSEKMMDWLQSTFGGKIYTRAMPKNENWKQCYNWVVGYQNAREVLLLVKDYLVVKQDRALLGIELMENWVTDNRGTPADEVSRRERIYRKFKELNATGLVQRERLNSEAPSITEG